MVVTLGSARTTVRPLHSIVLDSGPSRADSLSAAAEVAWRVTAHAVDEFPITPDHLVSLDVTGQLSKSMVQWLKTGL